MAWKLWMRPVEFTICRWQQWGPWLELAGAPSLQHGSSTLPSTKYSIQIPQLYITLSSCQVHPSAVDLEVSRFRNKMVINVLGEQKRIMKAAKEEGELSLFSLSNLFINSASWHFRWDHWGCCHQHGDSRLRVKPWMSDWNAIMINFNFYSYLFHYLLFNLACNPYCTNIVGLISWSWVNTASGETLLSC